MNVLFISNDPNIFVAGSETRIRMRRYADAIGELHILSQAPREAVVTQDGPLFLHPHHGSRFSLAKPARSIIETHSIEVVSAQDPFEHGKEALKAIQGTKAKLHIQIHTDFLSPWFVKGGGFRAPRVHVPVMNKVRRSIADEVLPQAHGIRVVSERIRTSLIERYGTRIKDPAVIPVPVTAVVPAPVPLPPHEFSFALMTASRLESEKRIEDILYAIGRIKYDYPSVGLFVIGSGREEAHLKRLTKKLGLSDRVIFVPWGTDVRRYMGSAQAYIQASAYEGYGRTLLEAALAGTPIITTDVGIVGEVFQGYKDVLSVPVADPAALALQIRGLVDDHQARELLAREAKRTAEAHLASVGDIPARIANDLSETLLRA